MILAMVFAAAVADAELVDLRSKLSQAAWSMCIDNRIEKLRKTKAIADAPKSVSVAFAMQQCHAFGQDLKRTLPDVVTKMLAAEGADLYEPKIVEMLTDEAFQRLEDAMRKEKEAS